MDMPEKLTAENGAKGVLMGEFWCGMSVECDCCCGDGEYEVDGEVCECDDCAGTGSLSLKVDIPWDSIKTIYDRIVKEVKAGNIKSAPFR